MSEIGFAVKRRCYECNGKFNADEVKIGVQWMLTEICKSCREKYKKLPDRLPKYIIELNETFI